MGIYESSAPCGCISETYTWCDPWQTSLVVRCAAHGGNAIMYAVAKAGREARNWAGPENPYADPPLSPQHAHASNKPADTLEANK